MENTGFKIESCIFYFITPLSGCHLVIKKQGPPPGHIHLPDHRESQESEGGCRNGHVE